MAYTEHWGNYKRKLLLKIVSQSNPNPESYFFQYFQTLSITALEFLGKFHMLGHFSVLSALLTALLISRKLGSRHTPFHLHLKFVKYTPAYSGR
jgi:hypothetical protein